MIWLDALIEAEAEKGVHKMLTIKVCYPNGGQLVKEVDSVMLRPANETALQRECVTYWEIGNAAEGSKCVDVYEGTVFVMNSNGKTVADYYLGILPMSEPEVVYSAISSGNMATGLPT